MSMNRAWHAAKGTVAELARDRTFWGYATLAIGPWAANTYYQIRHGQPLLPYAEETIHLLRGPLGARIGTTFMRHYHGRALTQAEQIGYGITGAALAGAGFELRERATNLIPALEAWTPDFNAADAAKDIALTAAGGAAEAVARGEKRF